MSQNRMQGILSDLTRSLDLDIGSGHEALTLAWADAREQHQVISLAAIDARQSMNLRTMPGAKLVVLRRPQGGFAGWAGVDADSDRDRPELFSQYVYPRYRGCGLGGLLEHVWWAYLERRGCATAYMRMELDSNNDLLKRRSASGYYREISPGYLAVDVKTALAAAVRARGPLDVDALPIRILR